MIDRLFLTAMLALAGSTVPLLAPRNIVAAATDAAQPREERDLKIGCAAPTAKGQVTFVRGGDGKVLLAALTDRPLADPALDIWLSPRFRKENAPARLSATQDWAFVHDVNRDGRIDQIAFLVGPLLMEPEVPDPDLPKEQDGRMSLTGKAQVRALLRHIRFGFWQAVDGDFDGVAEVHAWPARRNATGWYRGWMVTGGSGGSPSCQLIDRDETFQEPCARASKDRELVSAEATAHLWAADPDGVFAAMLDAAATCRLNAADLRP